MLCLIQSKFASSSDQYFLMIDSCSVLSSVVFECIVSWSLMSVEIWCCSKARSVGLRHQEASDFVRRWRWQSIDWRLRRADSSIWRLRKLCLSVIGGDLNITLQLVHCVHLTLIYWCVPRVRTCFGSRGFSVAAPTIWNSLPLDIRNSRSIASFRRQLKTFLFSTSGHL